MKKKFIPYWLFLTLFKFGAGLHYSLLAPLGAKVLPLWLVGLLIGAGSFLQLSFDVPAGRMLDKYGYKELLIITSIIFVLATSVLCFGMSPGIFITTVFLSTFGWLFFGPGVNAYTINQATREGTGKFFAFKDIFMSLGIVLSSAAIIFVIRLNISLIGIILAIILIGAAIAISLSPRERSQTRTEQHTASRHTRLEKNIFHDSIYAAKKLHPASTLLLALTLSGAIFYSIVWFVVPLLIATQIQNGVLGIGLGIFDFSVVVLGLMIGWLVDSYEKKTLILFGLFIFSLCGILLGFDFGLLFLLLGFLATTGDELASLSLWSWLYNLDHTHERAGLISGMINLFEDLGWTIGPIIAGICYGLIGPAWTLSIGGLFIALNLLLFFFIVNFPLPTLPKLPTLFRGPEEKPHRHHAKH